MASISSLGESIGISKPGAPGVGGGGIGPTPPSTGPGGGGSASDGLSQIDAGAGTVRTAIGTAANALGAGGGGQSAPNGPFPLFKKGGYVTKSGKINLGSGRVSTATKNKSNSNW